MDKLSVKEADLLLNILYERLDYAHHHGLMSVEERTHEALDMAIEALNKTQWISVNDKLPTPGERVIATNGTFTGEAYQGKDGYWHRHYGLTWERAFNGPDITHWIPMPQLRKDEL